MLSVCISSDVFSAACLFVLFYEEISQIWLQSNSLLVRVQDLFPNLCSVVLICILFSSVLHEWQKVNEINIIKTQNKENIFPVLNLISLCSIIFLIDLFLLCPLPDRAVQVREETLIWMLWILLLLPNNNHFSIIQSNLKRFIYIPSKINWKIALPHLHRDCLLSCVFWRKWNISVHLSVSQHICSSCFTVKPVIISVFKM